MESRKVVVVVEPTYHKNAETEEVAASFEAMGLTAFGMTEEVALAELKKVFVLDIQFNRKKNQLAEHLERLGVQWSWADEFSDEYEETSLESVPVREPPSAVRSWRRLRDESGLKMAA